jgi:hypothetical protein
MKPFKGKSNLKQYIQSKPKKWGFKIWIQANSNGYVNCFEPYQASTQDRSKYGPIGDFVLNYVMHCMVKIISCSLTIFLLHCHL